MKRIKEAWKDIPGYEGYYKVSTRGRVKSLERESKSKGDGYRLVRERILKPYTDTHGYNIVHLFKDGKRTFKIHRLVLFAFVGPCLDGMECCHDNGICGDNRLENLRWGTGKENQADRIRHGTSNRGKDSALAKVTEDDVIEIRKRWATGNITMRQIAKEYGITVGNIGFIVTGESWKDAGGPIHVPKKMPTKERALLIRADFNAETISQRELSKIYGVSEATISRIVNDKTYKDN